MSFFGIVPGLTRPFLFFALETVWLLLMYDCQSYLPNLPPAAIGR